MLTLNVKTRDSKEKAERLRAHGVLPAVYYGSKTESTPISISFGDFMKLWHEVGESTVFKIKNDEGKELNALVHEVELHPLTGEPRHADFYVVEKGQKVQVEVPLEFVGEEEAPVLKNFDATIVKVVHELEVEAEPQNLPHHIEVDVSGLEDLESSIQVKDLNLPDGVDAIADPKDTVVSVSEVIEEEEPEPEEIDFSEIEVEGERPAEEGGGEPFDEAQGNEGREEVGGAGQEALRQDRGKEEGGE